MNEIIRFSNILRDKNVPVSIRSTKDAFMAYRMFRGRDELREALFSVYVKDMRHADAFMEAYGEVFGTAGKDEPLESGEDSTEIIQAPDGDINGKEGESLILDDFNELKPEIEEIIDLRGDERNIIDRDMSTLDAFDPEIFELCRRLGIKIANRRSRRLRQSKRTRPDIRKSIRRNLKHGGTLIELLRSEPRERKSQHIFLSDVSGSCDWISNWFFCIVYAAQKTFYRSRFFDFDSKIVETTHLLDEEDLYDAFRNLRESRARNLMLHGTSNMYTAFREFLENVSFTGRSYIVILSDCRDWAGPKRNGVPESQGLISEMAEGARRVLILNPEPSKKWDAVDSCVSLYRDAGATIKEVRTLRQLAEAIEKL